MSSAHAVRFAGLPGPQQDKLTLYIFGPGFGESQVAALPDGRWLVVDRQAGCASPTHAAQETPPAWR